MSCEQEMVDITMNDPWPEQRLHSPTNIGFPSRGAKSPTLPERPYGASPIIFQQQEYDRCSPTLEILKWDQDDSLSEIFPNGCKFKRSASFDNISSMQRDCGDLDDVHMSNATHRESPLVMLEILREAKRRSQSRGRLSPPLQVQTSPQIRQVNDISDWASSWSTVEPNKANQVPTQQSILNYSPFCPMGTNGSVDQQTADETTTSRFNNKTKLEEPSAFEFQPFQELNNFHSQGGKNPRSQAFATSNEKKQTGAEVNPHSQENTWKEMNKNVAGFRSLAEELMGNGNRARSMSSDCVNMRASRSTNLKRPKILSSSLAQKSHKRSQSGGLTGNLPGGAVGEDSIHPKRQKPTAQNVKQRSRAQSADIPRTHPTHPEQYLATLQAAGAPPKNARVVIDPHEGVPKVIYIRPRGRSPLLKSWDYSKGIWVPKNQHDS